MREKASRPHRAFHKGWTLTVTRRLPRKAQAEWKKERRGRERERHARGGTSVRRGLSDRHIICTTRTCIRPDQFKQPNSQVQLQQCHLQQHTRYHNKEEGHHNSFFDICLACLRWWLVITITFSWRLSIVVHDFGYVLKQPLRKLAGFQRHPYWAFVCLLC